MKNRKIVKSEDYMEKAFGHVEELRGESISINSLKFITPAGYYF